jgi:hypothetical protein
VPLPRSGSGCVRTNLGRAAQPLHQPLRQLEAHVEAASSDVEQQITRRRDGGVAVTSQLAKRMQPRRARFACEPAQQIGADPDHAGQLCLRHPEAHRALDTGDVGQHVLDLGLATVTHRQYEEDRRLSRVAENRLRLGR